MEKYQGKYRIPSARLQNYDYSKAGMYFITICTADREYYFGKISKGQMHLSPIGKITWNEWYKTLELRSDMNLSLGAFVVMPNHIHGIIIIGENEYNRGKRGMGGFENNNNRVAGNDDGFGDDDGYGDGIGRDAMHCVSTNTPDTNTPDTNTPDTNTPDTNIIKTGKSDNINKIFINDSRKYKNKFAPQSKNIASIIRGYKSAVTKNAHQSGYNFKWQARYYDHIIRNKGEFYRISRYIENNPLNWKEDKFN